MQYLLNSAGLQQPLLNLLISSFCSLSLCAPQPWQLTDSMCDAADPINLQLMDPFLDEQALV